MHIPLQSPINLPFLDVLGVLLPRQDVEDRIHHDETHSARAETGCNNLIVPRAIDASHGLALNSRSINVVLSLDLEPTSTSFYRTSIYSS